MRAAELLAVLDGVDPDTEVIATDGEGNFFGITDSERCQMVNITWVDDTTGWWPPEQFDDDCRGDAKAAAEHNVLVLRGTQWSLPNPPPGQQGTP